LTGGLGVPLQTQIVLMGRWQLGAALPVWCWSGCRRWGSVPRGWRRPGTQLESGGPSPDRGERVRHGSEQPHRGLPTLAGVRDRGRVRVTGAGAERQPQRP